LNSLEAVADIGKVRPYEQGNVGVTAASRLTPNNFQFLIPDHQL